MKESRKTVASGGVMRLATAVALLVASTLACADTMRIGSTDGGRTWIDLDPALLPSIQGGAGLKPGVTLYGVNGSVLSYSKATDSWADVDLLPGCYGNAVVDAATSGVVYNLNYAHRERSEWRPPSVDDSQS